MIEKRSIVITITVLLIAAVGTWLYTTTRQPNKPIEPIPLAQLSMPSLTPVDTAISPSATPDPIANTPAIAGSVNQETTGNQSPLDPSPTTIPINPTAATGTTGIILPASLAAVLVGCWLLLSVVTARAR